MPMNSYAQYRLELARDDIRRRVRDAERERMRPNRPSFSVRQSLGFSIIRIGERMAAEPSRFRPAQSR
jgi:hypothetical protein